MRKGFNFYRSYWEVANELNDKDRLAFYDALLKKQFTNIDSELNGMVKFAYLSQKHSIDKQIDGYVNKTIQLHPNQDPWQGGSVGALADPWQQEKEKEKEKVKEKNNIYRQFSHLSISVEEIEKLKIDFTIEQIESVLDQVQNFSGNKKYTSLYLTAKNWLKKNQPKQQEGISPEELKAIKLGFLKP
jgi:hypothetical protein